MQRVALEPKDFPYFDYRRFTFSLGIVAAGRVWLSGSTAACFDAARGMVVDGNLVEQAGVIFEKMRVTLAAGRLDLGDVARLVQYVTPSALADLPRLAALRTDIFAGSAPAVSTIVVKSLLRSEAIIEIEAVAVPGGCDDIEYLPAIADVDAKRTLTRAINLLHARGLDSRHVMRRIEFFTPTASSYACRPDDGVASVLKIVMPRLTDPAAGVQIEMTASRKPDTHVLYASAEGDPSAGDVVGQCRDVYARIGGLLRAAGAGLDMVVKTTEFVTPAGLDAYRKTADLRREMFAPPYPAATGVVCERLMTPGAQLAVEAIAVVGAL